MHGSGNDFVIIDGTRTKYNLTKDGISLMANRHFGIGCDQVLLLENATAKGIDFSCRIFNADGREAEQCGNGMCCLAKFAYENNLTDKKNLSIATCARQVKTQLEDDDSVTVNMGDVITKGKVTLKMENNAETEVSVISVGNPHAVILVNDISLAPVSTLGHNISKHQVFPEGVNAEFMQIVDRNYVKLRVFERGAGESLACGSGATASVAYGILENLLDKAVDVSLPGGILKITWENPKASIFLKGPAAFVFQGNCDIP
jgi:diaminopimelate epimerase